MEASSPRARSTTLSPYALHVDDRFEIPQEALKPLFPALADGEVPSYDVHIAPIVKRYCISCHRAGKDSNNYFMSTYEEILTTGDQKDDNVIAGDPNSYLLQVIQGTPIPDPQNPGENLIGVMPPRGISSRMRSTPLSVGS